MKTKLLSGAGLAILGVAVASLSAQTQTSTSTTTNYIETSKLIGTKVRSNDGDVGTIKDVVLDNNGCMAYTVLSTGGGGGSRTTSTTKTVAVPWSVYDTTSFSPESRILTARVDRQRIYNAPVFDYAHVREYSTNPGYISQVYSYYGVSPSAGVGVGVSTGANTTTNTATTGYNASANTAASPNANTATSPNANTAGSPATATSPASGYSTEAARNASPGTSPAANASPA